MTSGRKQQLKLKKSSADLVIPTEDWNRWWQTARAKLKKDTKVECPKELKDPFRLLTEEVPHEVALHKAWKQTECQCNHSNGLHILARFPRNFEKWGI